MEIQAHIYGYFMELSNTSIFFDRLKLKPRRRLSNRHEPGLDEEDNDGENGSIYREVSVGCGERPDGRWVDAILAEASAEGSCCAEVRF